MTCNRVYDHGIGPFKHYLAASRNRSVWGMPSDPGAGGGVTVDNTVTA